MAAAPAAPAHDHAPSLSPTLSGEDADSKRFSPATAGGGPDEDASTSAADQVSLHKEVAPSSVADKSTTEDGPVGAAGPPGSPDTSAHLRGKKLAVVFAAMLLCLLLVALEYVLSMSNDARRSRRAPSGLTIRLAHAAKPSSRRPCHASRATLTPLTSKAGSRRRLS